MWTPSYIRPLIALKQRSMLTQCLEANEQSFDCALFGIWGSSSSNILAVVGSGTIILHERSVGKHDSSGAVESLDGMWRAFPVAFLLQEANI
jgi:hypothetical protein